LGGIVGVFTLDGRPVAETVVARMKAVTTVPAASPHESSSGCVVWFDGRLDNPAEFSPASGGDTPICLSDADLVGHAYERFGDRFAGRLNGDFALALVDVRRRRLVLARDVMALQPLYYCQIPGAVLFASEIKCLLAHSAVVPAVDEDALASLVLDYWCDEHRTCFKGIYSVPPGHSVTATAERLERRAEWTFEPSAQIRYRSFADYREHFTSLFEQSIRRRLRAADGVAITVSGGLDSSSIFCQASALQRREAMHVRVHGISMTFPPKSAADEQHFLRDIEDKYDTRITRLPVARYSFVDRAGAAVRCLDSPGYLEDAQIQIFESARHAGCSVLLSGFFGDQMLSDRGYLIDLVRRGRWLKVRHDVRQFHAWATDVEPRFFTSDLCKRIVRALPPRWAFRAVKRLLKERRFRERYPSWFSAGFRRRAEAVASKRFDASHRFATAHAEQYYRHATAGHYVNIVRCEQALARAHGLALAYPFRDRDLVAFLMAIPGEIVNWQGVPKGLLRQALSGVLPDAIRDRRWKADFTALENEAMRHDAAQVLSMLGRDGLAVRNGYVDAGALDRVAPTFATLAGDAGAPPGWRLTDLAGLELWVRQFFDVPVEA
jgi:asparagine synthase (glutamine-hydrolysing)